jgi:hypothetical protein
MRTRVGRAACAVCSFPRGCERKACRSRADRCNRGAMGKELCDLGVVGSTTILLNNLSYPY